MSGADGREVTVGIDIGTSSVKAVAADADGNVVARARVPHAFHIPAPLRFEHDAARAWHDGPRAALEALGAIEPRAVSVAAMVPSLTAVDDDGMPVTPGLLYGDERGGVGTRSGIAEAGELVEFLRWTAAQRPDARGYWPANAVANHALCGAPVISTTLAATALPLFDWVGWDETLLAELGVRSEQMPSIVASGQPAGRVRGFRDCVLEGGTIDALGEQVVAGADDDGDALVILGTTLITWCVVPEGTDGVPGYYSIPHTAPGKFLHGGPSNAGGLFLNWARGLLGEGGPEPDPEDIPVWVPYPRGERVPFQDPRRRASVHGLDLMHGAAAVRRAAFESAGFVARRVIEASPLPVRRIVATGGGTRVDEWVDTLAYCTGLPVDVTPITEGGALGAAFLARCAAGLETSMNDARRWARVGRTVEPDPRWQAVAAERYARFGELAG